MSKYAEVNLSVASLTIFLITSFAIATQPTQENSMVLIPKVMLWAWERPENFEKAGLSSEIGVAYYAAIIRIINNRIVVKPRLQPLVVQKNTTLIAVCRIELDHSKKTELTDELANKLASAVLKNSGPSDIKALQIDFDALRNERPFYREVLRKVRTGLTQAKSLSITSLLSWCLCDNWMQDITVNEIVPMYFRLGADRTKILQAMRSCQFNSEDAQCDNSIGISLDEPELYEAEIVCRHRHSKNQTPRVYVFNPRSWDKDAIDTALAISQRLSK